MSDRAPVRTRPRALLRFWRVNNWVVRKLTWLNPYWVLLETVGRNTGCPRRTPLATGPIDNGAMLFIAVHGRRAAWVRNIESNPTVRVRKWFRWVTGTATVHELTPAEYERFNRYARLGPTTFGLDYAPPTLVRVHPVHPRGDSSAAVGQ
ncbi:nitroreductase family deazaflavin-dependent oxidoreductase [Nocardia huaxiensis]|uniref:Nitroreductase family deazaflavin-dependent oxidoreductase n=1 Tax=Nocardia huaxiensis TaxID=2755382 RepID=A0A7D6VBQ9_9NOCA|nr:nitroreductase family deazaflavin-dependent oxidoreductase [Nocardia huaxiensis]QLY31714.1 nitroreductase family deazaflavin-dependent oxidoreductase [Nocardia huaxiensis]UFS95272.1 nitroreductase family deazaflavin-dependent oxidoreductase [Nocardia huaxiensis]